MIDAVNTPPITHGGITMSTGHKDGVGYSNGSTSKAAAESMAEVAPTLEEQVYQALLDLADAGATDDELEVALGMSHQTLSARRRALVKAGRVHDSGRTRATRSGRQAIVWVVKDNDQVDLVDAIDQAARKIRKRRLARARAILRDLDDDQLGRALGALRDLADG